MTFIHPQFAQVRVVVKDRHARRAHQLHAQGALILAALVLFVAAPLFQRMALVGLVLVEGSDDDAGQANQNAG